MPVDSIKNPVPLAIGSFCSSNVSIKKTLGLKFEKSLVRFVSCELQLIENKSDIRKMDILSKYLLEIRYLNSMISIN